MDLARGIFLSLLLCHLDMPLLPELNTFLLSGVETPPAFVVLQLWGPVIRQRARIPFSEERV